VLTDLRKCTIPTRHKVLVPSPSGKAADREGYASGSHRLLTKRSMSNQRDCLPRGTLRGRRRCDSGRGVAGGVKLQSTGARLGWRGTGARPLERKDIVATTKYRE